MMMFNLSGKTAIVTGGNGGIGLAMAAALGEAGASVALVARDETKGAKAAAELGNRGIDAAFFSADVAVEQSVRETVDAVAARFGSVDILVNNAGIAIRKRPEDYSLAEWHKVLDTNLTSAFLMAHAAYPYMRRAGAGKIVNIGSIMSYLAAPFTVAYSASKGGLVQLTKALATAWAADNIQVNAILPGWIDTDLTVSAREQVDGLNDNVMHRTPAKRWGSPDDFKGPVVFLSSSASNFVTGTQLLVDGGYSALA
ncbi:2-dehydro-3-deoxy-D-gluconate 5-dehydrogenase [Ensifer psoraleae]|uniref:SDR family NAD(P)-dependent oxidoreductase n=1 Tax=Sinorhizobium psoraleae TaxID=520838 RepID=UPI001569A0D8|nr:glucose 1-dehydrogenase [Sinorhizobium psoraleae]NRP72184.1 2-dehydro-3-deoxy-D-gluconate 5-dehydrogenase [Sinorhizobium psoraleae]